MPELTSSHLDDFTLLRYTAGDLPNSEREAAAGHLSECSKCGDVMRQIRALDAELKQAAENGAFPSEAFELPAGDPFRVRPGLAGAAPRVHGLEALAALALDASDRGAEMSAGILDAACARRLDSFLASFSLADLSNRFALLYALQESGRRIAEAPVRWLLFAEAVLARLRADAGTDAGEASADRVLPRPVVLGQAHLLAGQACNWTQEFERAKPHFELAYRCFSGSGGDEVSLAFTEHMEAQRRSFIGRGREGLLLARRAGKTFEAFGLEDWVARAKVVQGLALFDLGRQEEAVEAYRTALPVFERLQLWSNYVGALNSVGTSLQKLGRLDEARREYARALRRLSREQHRSHLALIRHGLADVLFSARRFRDSAISYAQASRQYADCGLFARTLISSLYEIESWARHGDVLRARHRLDLLQNEIARAGGLDAGVLRQIGEALSGQNPDFELLASLRDLALTGLEDSSTAYPA